MAVFVTVTGQRIDLGNLPVDVGLLVQDVLHAFEACRGAAKSAEEFAQRVRTMIDRRFPEKEEQRAILNGEAGEVFRDCHFRLRLDHAGEWGASALFNPVRLLFEWFLCEPVSQAEFARNGGLSPSTLSSAFRFLREWDHAQSVTEPRMTLETFATACRTLGIVPGSLRTATAVDGDRQLLESGTEGVTAREAALLHAIGVATQLLRMAEATSKNWGANAAIGQSKVAVQLLAFHLSVLFEIADASALARFVQEVLRALTVPLRFGAIDGHQKLATLFELGLTLPTNQPAPIPQALASIVRAEFAGLAIDEPIDAAIDERDEGTPSLAFRTLVAQRWQTATEAADECARLLFPSRPVVVRGNFGAGKAVVVTGKSDAEARALDEAFA